MTTKPVVRIATQADRDSMITLLHLMHDENGVAPLDVPKMISALDRGLARNGALIGVIGEPGHVVASIGLVLHQWWYSQDWHLEDCWNFVHPQHRRPGYASAMLDFAKSTADALEVQLLIGILSSERTEAKEHMYIRKFGKPAGAAFVYPSIAKIVTRPVEPAAETPVLQSAPEASTDGENASQVAA